MNEREIFAAALEKRSAAERAPFLDGVCGADAALRERIEALLAEQASLGSFLESPPAGVVASAAATIDQPLTERPGTQIGPYKLLQQIGEGGFGVVYMAEQLEPVRRKVALKLIKPGMDTRQVIARFDAERQALAVMDHPNIAKVLDAGTVGKVSTSSSLETQIENLLHAGRPYFVMELVRGIPITQYCDENNLPVRERLELFATVCQAIQHAHTKGIIHRDIKPTNVLVTRQDGQPVVKVIDFGVAKAMGQQLTDKTLFTEFAQMIGTPLYMSPEQAELSSVDIDTRSDIYSLGVLLYELLTGTTPVSKEQLKQAAFDEIRRIIREDEPPKPSTRLSTAEAAPGIAAQRHTEPAKLLKLVRGELDWIVMKALDKDRSRRYETASGFAMDVQRYLADEPVQACPPSPWYRFRKFARRHKRPLLVVAVILLALIGGVIGTTWGMMRAELARGVAESERDEKERARKLAVNNEKLALKARDAERLALKREAEQRQRAEENLKLATAVMDEIIVKPARQRMTLYTNDRAKGLAADPEREKLEGELLAKGLAFYEKLAQNNATDWVARRERAKAYANVGFIQLHYRNFAESEKAYRQALDLMEKLADERPEDFDNRFNLAYEYHWFCRPYLDSNRPQPAEEITRHALALCEKLVADFPDRSPIAQELRAACHRNVGIVLQNVAKPREAEQAFRQTVAIEAELAAASPSAGRRQALAHDWHRLADLLSSQKRFAEADTAYQASRSGWEKLIAELNHPEHRINLGGTLMNWAFSCKSSGRLKEAEKLFREAAIEFETLQTKFPIQSRWAMHELGYIYLFLGELLSGLGGREEDAEEAYRQSLAYHEKQLTQDPEKREYQERLTWSYAALARLLRKTNRPLEASQLDAKRIELVKKLASTATLAIEFNGYAWNLVIDADPDFQRGPLAAELANKAVELEPAQGMYWNTLGTAHYRAGNWQLAIEAARKASALYQARFLGYDAFVLAMAHWQLGEKEQARKWFALAVIWMEKHDPKNEELIGFRAEAASLVGLPEKLTPEQELAKADDVKFYTLALEADPQLDWARAARGSAYAERGQWMEAAADFARASELNPDPLHHYRQALVRVQRGDKVGYRQLCADMLARFGAATNADSAHWVVWTCVLGADAVADWKLPLQLAEKAVADKPNNYRALNQLGAALYRAGQYQESLKRLTEAEAVYGPDDERLSAIAYNWLFLAMAHHRLGHVEEEEKWHDKAVQSIDQKTTAAVNPLPWNRRLTLQLLRREAEELLKQK